MRALPEVWVHRHPNGVKLGSLDGGRASSSDGAGTPSWLHVLSVLARSDFRARYRAQALGVIWSLLNPLVMMSILSIIFTRFFPNNEQKHFPVFMLIGLVLWQWVGTSLNAGTAILVSNSEVIKRTVFPRQLLPISAVLSYGINFCVESSIVVASVFIWPHAFRLSSALLVVPIALVALGALLVGLTLATSVLNVIYRDVAFLVQTALQLLYWLTPLVYSLKAVPEKYQPLIMCNPIGAVLVAVRGALMDGQWPTRMLWTGMLAPTALVLLVGWAIFRHYERMALDYV
jgi:ABC-type polysaccharide/polyol phosphate export permease